MSALNNRNLIYGGAAGLAIVLAGGYFSASAKGVEAFEDFLYDKDLTDAIRYDDASYSPLSDSIALKGVDLNIVVMEFGDQQQRITGRLDRVKIAGARDENRKLISFSGYELVTDPDPTRIQENMLYQMLAEPLKLARTLGIKETRLDGAVGYAYERDDEKLTLTVELDAENLARNAIELRLQRTRPLFEIDPEKQIQAAIFAPQQLLAEFGRIELVGARAGLEDYGAFERMARLSALGSYNYATALNEEEVPFEAMKAGMHVGVNPQMKQQVTEGDLDEDSIKALQGFIEKGGNLEIEVETKRPVRLADLIKNDKLHRDISIEIDD